MSFKNISIYFYYNKYNTYSLNVLAGAIETTSFSHHLKLYFMKSFEELTEKVRLAVENRDKTIICWSFCSPMLFDSRRELKVLKNIPDSSDIVHIAGGVHTTAEPKETLRADFSIVAIGEGEKTIIEIVSRLINGEKLNNIRGTALFLEKQYISNGSGERINLDNFPPFAPTMVVSIR